MPVYMVLKTHCVRNEAIDAFALIVKFDNEESFEQEKCEDFDSTDKLFDMQLNHLGWSTNRYHITVVEEVSEREAKKKGYVVF